MSRRRDQAGLARRRARLRYFPAMLAVVLLVELAGCGKPSGKVKAESKESAATAGKPLTRPSPTEEEAGSKATAAKPESETPRVLIQPVRIPAGAPLLLRLEQHVPNGVAEGAVVRLSAAGGLRYGNAIAIAPGAPVTARVAGSGRRGLFRSNYAVITIDSVLGVDGQQIPLRADAKGPNGLDLSKPVRGGDHLDGILAAKGSEFAVHTAEEVVIRAPQGR